MDDILSKGTQRFPMAVIDGMDARRRQHLISGKYLEKKKEKAAPMNQLPFSRQMPLGRGLCVSRPGLNTSIWRGSIGTEEGEATERRKLFGRNVCASIVQPTDDRFINKSRRAFLRCSSWFLAETCHRNGRLLLSQVASSLWLTLHLLLFPRTESSSLLYLIFLLLYFVSTSLYYPF